MPGIFVTRLMNREITAFKFLIRGIVMSSQAREKSIFKLLFFKISQACLILDSFCK